MPVSPARSLAFDILLRVERESAYASELLHSAASENLSVRDHALATELVLGVERWRSQLDETIAQASSTPLAKLDFEILVALRIAVYQLRHLDRVPGRAAIFESVELVKRARKRSAVPFVNAVLRRLSASTHPVARDETTPAGLAQAFAHPPWLVERWAAADGMTTARRICEFDQQIPKTALRLRLQAAEITLAKQAVTLSPGALLSSARIVDAGDVTNSEAFVNGEVVIQDEGSQLVVALVGASLASASNDPLRILDCCAAPGGKTLALADRNPAAQVTAVDVHPHRARLLRRLLQQKSSAARIAVLAADATQLPFSFSFDRVLTDVPCSGTGTLARNPEIKWRLDPRDLADLQKRQIAILRSALAQVAAEGRVVYSTCSLEKEENEDVIASALAGTNSFRVLDCREELERLRTSGELLWQDVASLCRGPFLRTIPGIHPCDGFFAAVLQKV